MMKKIVSLSVLGALMFLFSSCGITENGLSKGINLFPVQKDIDLGKKVAQQIASSPEEYPILDSTKYPEVYQYLYRIRNKILNSGKVTHRNDFSWELKIIKKDEVKNAFCTPGGHIYVYTGLMKFLDSEDELAGVLAHEIGHADLRHSTEQMTKIYGVQTLLGLIAGDYQLLKQITTKIIGLKFSRSDEAEADQASVTYLCPTDYSADAAAKFFQKIKAAGGSSIPEFLSTHPSPEHRIAHFHAVSRGLGCTGTKAYKSRYQNMLTKLP